MNKKRLKKISKKLISKAKQRVIKLKRQGWTQEDFAKFLASLLEGESEEAK